MRGGGGGDLCGLVKEASSQVKAPVSPLVPPVISLPRCSSASGSDGRGEIQDGGERGEKSGIDYTQIDKSTGVIQGCEPALSEKK